MVFAIFAALAAQSSFVCDPISVWDGDGPVHCRSGEKIRIAGIAARELDGSCDISLNVRLPRLALGESHSDDDIPSLKTLIGRRW